MNANGMRVRDRVMAAVAGGLVLLLGVDPGLLGAAWSGAAQAAGSGVINESRAQNLAAAAAALGVEVPAGSVPLAGAGADPAVPVVPLELPAVLPTAAEATVDVPVADPVQLGGMTVPVDQEKGEESPDRVTV